MSKPAEEFNYVIAHVCDDGRLHCYSYGSQVQFGTLKQAIGLRDYIRMTTVDTRTTYNAYKVNVEEIK